MYNITFAAVQEDVPDAKTWSDSLDIEKLGAVKAPISILLLDKFLAGEDVAPVIQPLRFDQTLCHKFSFISCADPTNFSYALQINKLGKMPTIDDLVKLSGTDAIIYGDGAEISFKGKGESQPLKLSSIKKFDKSFSLRKVLDNVLVVLGYDGVVLDERGDFILVGSLDSRLKGKDLQGVLIENSDDAFAIAPEKAKGASALISLVGKSGGYAVFKTVINASEANVKIGQKVIIESRH